MLSSHLFGLAAAVLSVPAVQAHMAMWHPSVYGFDKGYEPVTPLAGLSFNQWWFHGYASDRPREVMNIVPGRDLTVEIACNRDTTSWGSRSSPDACPGDAGAYHAGGSTGSQSGWGGNSESNLMGCAIAIAYKNNAQDVQMDDFIVMSVQENCVRQRDTTFAVPANLPACPEGGCTCAWFWQGRNSAEEMYMNGFRCDVQGGVANAEIPRPAPPRRGNLISGPTQPMYWANSPSNLDYTPGWNTRPSYNSAFGWVNGAQTAAFGSGTNGGGFSGGGGSSGGSSGGGSTGGGSGGSSGGSSGGGNGGSSGDSSGGGNGGTSSGNGGGDGSWESSSYGGEGSWSASATATSSSTRDWDTPTSTSDSAAPTSDWTAPTSTPDWSQSTSATSSQASVNASSSYEYDWNSTSSTSTGWAEPSSSSSAWSEGASTSTGWTEPSSSSSAWSEEGSSSTADWDAPSSTEPSASATPSWFNHVAQPGASQSSEVSSASASPASTSSDAASVPASTAPEASATTGPICRRSRHRRRVRRAHGH